MGSSWDDLMPYPTPKFVHIDNWKLGLFNYLIKVVIVLYIFLYLMVWQCTHLKINFGQGSSQMRMWHPTKDDCSPFAAGCTGNFTAMTQLPYCKQDPRNSGVADSNECKFYDGFELNPGTPNPDTYMVTTKVTDYPQVPGCKPAKENNWACENPSTLWVPETGKDTSHYVADIENFKIHILHFAGGKVQKKVGPGAAGFLVMQNHKVLPPGASSLQLAQAQHGGKMPGSTEKAGISGVGGSQQKRSKVSFAAISSSVGRVKAALTDVARRQTDAHMRSQDEDDQIAHMLSRFDVNSDGVLCKDEMFTLLQDGFKVNETIRQDGFEQALVQLSSSRATNRRVTTNAGLAVDDAHMAAADGKAAIGTVVAMQSGIVDEDKRPIMHGTAKPTPAPTPPPVFGAPSGWQIPLGRDTERSEAFPSVWFDEERSETVISLEDILKLARTGGAGYLDEIFNVAAAKTLRDSGGVILISILYSNIAQWDFWGTAPIHYDIYAQFLNTVDSNTLTYVDTEMSTDKSRVVKEKTGIRLQVQVSSQIQEFAVATFATVMSTSLALLAASLIVSDFLMCYVPVFNFRNDRVQVVKYQPWVKEVVSEKQGLYEDAENILPEVLADAARWDRELTPEELVVTLMMLDRRLSRIDAFSIGMVVDPDDKRVHHIREFEEEYLMKRQSRG